MRAPRLTVKRARDLRRRMTLPEGLLWRELSGKKVAGSRWRKQHPIGPWVLDFYCAEAKLCVEIDGADHVWGSPHDASRTAWLAERGIRVMRFPAREVLSDEGLVGVLEAIAAAVAPSTSFAGPPPPLCGWGTDAPGGCAGVGADGADAGAGSGGASDYGAGLVRGSQPRSMSPDLAIQELIATAIAMSGAD